MKIIFGLIALIVLIFGGYLIIQRINFVQKTQAPAVTSSASNVSIRDGRQIVEINAKDGYTPKVSTVKAGMPTVLRFNTKGTFDCSSQVSIPSMNISQALPPSGITEVALGTLEEGVLQGMCGMGMYPFQINVQS